MARPKIVMKDKLYIPAKFLQEDKVVKAYTHYEFDDNICRACDLRDSRPCADCRSCEWGGLKQSFNMAGYKVVGKIPYYTFPLGDIDNVEHKLNIDLDRFDFVDLTVRRKFTYPIEFTGDLFDYQETPVALLVKRKMGILKSKPRTGKCTAGDEIVDTSAGQLSMESLWREFGVDGQESVRLSAKLTTETAFGKEGISWIHRKRSKMLSIKTHIGHSLKATPEHPVFVVTPTLEIAERRMDELRVGDWVVSNPECASRTRRNARLTKIQESAHSYAKKITQPSVMSADLAYVLGCLIANGSLASARHENCASLRFCSDDDSVSTRYANKVESLFGVEAKRVYPEKRSAEVVVHSAQLIDWLSANGLCMETASGKSIPECVLRSSQQVHRAFLSGYMSCDSSVYANFIEQITASEKLHKQLAVMFMSLGCVATARITNKAATNGSGIKRPYYCLTLAANNMRKLVEQVEITKYVNEGRNSDSKVYGDADQIPFVVDAIRALPFASTRYYEGKPSQNKDGTLARNTLLRVKREELPDHLRSFLSYADGVYFQQVKEIKKLKEDWVYDLTVECSHTFIASGFMVHNTVMAVAAAVRNQNRTIIMADQKDFLDGFYETIEAMTNLPALEEETGKKLFGFPKTLKDYETFQIILITYQQLIKDSKISRKRLRLLRKFYGALIIDEVHRSATPTFSKVLSRMTTRMRIGLSATPQRKDKREVLPYHFIGPVIAQTKAEALTPAISVHPTPSTVKTKSQFNGPAGWVRFTQFLARNNDRNMMIVDSVLRDLNNGRNIAIPIMYKEHAAWLKKEIDFAYGSEICALFMGGAKNAKLRKGIVDAARAGKVRVVIGVRKLIQIGINIPQWDTLYSIMPMNNAPNWEQESYRILTPLKDKKQPMIRMFVDTNMQRSVGCFKSTLSTSLGFGHMLTKQSRERVKELFGSALLDKPVASKKGGAPVSKLSRGMF